MSVTACIEDPLEVIFLFHVVVDAALPSYQVNEVSRDSMFPRFPWMCHVRPTLVLVH